MRSAGIEPETLRLPARFFNELSYAPAIFHTALIQLGQPKPTQ